MRLLSRVLTCISILTGLCSCSSQPGTVSGSTGGQNISEIPPSASAPSPDSAAAITGGLPPLPPGRKAHGLEEISRSGKETFSRGPGTQEAGNALELQAGPGGLSWAVWELSASDELRYLDFSLDLPLGAEAWLALADYSAGRWQLSGPIYGDRVVELDPQAQVSPGQLMYAAVVVSPGNSATVEGLSLITFHSNAAPSAALQATPLSGNAPLMVNFDASASSDPEDEIERYLWNFDGSSGFESQTFSPGVSYVYTQGGNFSARVTVVDADGEVATTTVDISVNEAPVANLALLPSAVKRYESCTLDASLSFDPDGSIVTYEWDADANGSYEANTGAEYQLQTSFAQPGYKTIRLRLTDDQGAQATAQALLLVEGWGDKQHLYTDNVGFYTSMAIVEGNPAACFVNSGDLYFVRALDPKGDAWNPEVVVDTTGTIGQGMSLAVINGRPAVAYQESTSQMLRYSRAQDSFGSAWQMPVTPDPAAPTGFNASLRDINGRPAIAYFIATANNLGYVRAGDADGSIWGNTIAPDTVNDTGRRPSLQLVNGTPAISYQYGTGQDLRFIRAIDAAGDFWNAAVDVETVDNCNASSLAVVNGMPAIAFTNSTRNCIQYVRAGDADGSMWGNAIDINPPASGGIDPQLALFNGAPVVCFDDSSRLIFVRASDFLGTGWYYPEVADGIGNTGESPSMVIAAGQPAMVFQDDSANALGFVRYQP